MISVLFCCQRIFACIFGEETDHLLFFLLDLLYDDSKRREWDLNERWTSVWKSENKFRKYEKKIICHKNSLEKDFMLQDRQFPIGKMKKVIRIFKH